MLVNQTIRIELINRDLIDEPVDIITNAANKHLTHDGGLAKMIVEKGGKKKNKSG